LWLKVTLGKQFSRPHLEKPIKKTGLVEWLKVKALNSSHSITKKKMKAESIILVDFKA
jgi:hypothetical protein